MGAWRFFAKGCYRTTEIDENIARSRSLRDLVIRRAASLGFETKIRRS